MDAIKYLKEKNRMCKKLKNCYNCPLYTYKKQDCSELERNEPEKAVGIVEKWSAENPQKTNLQDFLEKYPNAIMRDGNIPYNCAQFLGYVKDCKKPCKECWNRPLEG